MEVTERDGDLCDQVLVIGDRLANLVSTIQSSWYGPNAKVTVRLCFANLVSARFKFEFRSKTVVTLSIGACSVASRNVSTIFLRSNSSCTPDKLRSPDLDVIQVVIDVNCSR